MSTAKPLSPASQAVKDHFLANVPINLEHGIAAALRDLVTNHGTKTMGGSIILNGDAVLAIATELEGHQPARPAGWQPIGPDKEAMALAVGRELRRPDA